MMSSLERRVDRLEQERGMDSHFSLEDLEKARKRAYGGEPPPLEPLPPGIHGIVEMLEYARKRAKMRMMEERRALENDQPDQTC